MGRSVGFLEPRPTKRLGGLHPEQAVAIDRRPKTCSGRPPQSIRNGHGKRRRPIPQHRVDDRVEPARGNEWSGRVMDEHHVGIARHRSQSRTDRSLPAIPPSHDGTHLSQSPIA